MFPAKEMHVYPYGSVYEFWLRTCRTIDIMVWCSSSALEFGCNLKKGQTGEPVMHADRISRTEINARGRFLGPRSPPRATRTACRMHTPCVLARLKHRDERANHQGHYHIAKQCFDR